MRPILISFVLFTALSLFGADQSDPRFEKWLNRSQNIYATHHMIAYIRLAHLDSKGHRSGEAEFRYDRYPDKIERISRNDVSFVRKKGKKWIQSDDWGETGEPPEPEALKLIPVVISYADLPLRTKGESRDKSQGAVVVRVVDQRKTKEGDEEIVFEQGREHQNPDLNYPKYTFFRYKDADSDDVVLSEFSGPVYDSGGGKVQLDVRYDYMVSVKMEEITHGPSAPDKNVADEKAPEPTKDKSASLPPPISDKIYTFVQIQKQKAELKDKIVRLEILYLLGEPSDLLGDGTQRYIVKDTSKGATPYGQVAFPREGLEKMGLAQDPHREGPFTLYARVHVFPEKKAAAICVAVGMHVAAENGKATYSW
jgi:hypothetical protein